LFPAPAHVVRKPCLIGTASGCGGGGRSAASGGGGGGGSGRSSSTSVTSVWPAPPSASAGGPSTCSCRRIVPKKSGGKRLKIPNPQRTAVHPVETKKKQNRCWHAIITPPNHMKYAYAPLAPTSAPPTSRMAEHAVPSVWTPSQPQILASMPQTCPRQQSTSRRCHTARPQFKNCRASF
jgi:hypothetical protein